MINIFDVVIAEHDAIKDFTLWEYTDEPNNMRIVLGYIAGVNKLASDLIKKILEQPQAPQDTLATHYETTPYNPLQAVDHDDSVGGFIQGSR